MKSRAAMISQLIDYSIISNLNTSSVIFHNFLLFNTPNDELLDEKIISR